MAGVDTASQALEAAVAATRLRFEDGEDPAWAASPYAWLRRLPSSRRGAAGAAVVEAVLVGLGRQVGPSPDCEADRLVDGRRVEVKLSTLWASGEFRFQQLRDQNYESVAMLGVAPFEVRLWWVPKAVAWERAAPQHCGAKGSDTRWLRFAAAAPPAWLGAFGGELADAVRVIEAAGDGGAWPADTLFA